MGHASAGQMGETVVPRPLSTPLYRHDQNEAIFSLRPSLMPAADQQVEGSSTLSGNIYDGFGALVPGAKISLRDRESERTFETVSNAEGKYRLVVKSENKSNGGIFRIEVVRDPFKVFIIEAYQLFFKGQMNIDISLTCDECERLHADENTAALCGRLHEIKKLPYRDPNDTDPIYEALMAKGKAAMPCLIDKITDETPMPDPREAPPWRHYTVGDTAVFILVRMADKEKDLIPEMLPQPYKKEWETNGVYAYFNYVLEPENRRELQEWWRWWIKENSDDN